MRLTSAYLNLSRHGRVIAHLVYNGRRYVAHKRYIEPEASGTIYFITIGDPTPQYVKIGYTSGKPEKRMSALQTGCPVKLRLFGHVPGGMDLERSLHMELANYCSHGEWFRFEGRVEEVVGSLLTCGGY